MKTGEGKTLVATLAVYLNALEGKGVHVVTVNDYLAKRDAGWMGQVYRFLGLTVGSLGFFPAMDVVRQALPMVLTMLKMALVICIPLVLLIGTYDLKTVVTVSCVQFALFFVDFWFQLARWIDSTILDALYGWGFGADRPHTNFDPLIGLNNAFGDMLLNFVMAMMFIVLPGFWVAALAWVGVRVGNISQMLSAATDGAKSAGGKGADLAIKAAKAK